MKTLYSLLVFFSMTAYSQTPYEQLSALYHGTSTPASLNDFEKTSVTNSHIKCVYAEEKSDFLKSNNPWQWTYIFQKEEGPLFPEKLRTVVAFMSSEQITYLKSATYKAKKEFGDVIQNTTSSTDFIVSTEKAKYSFRKSGELISYKSESNLGKPDQVTRYGYCWNETKLPPATTSPTGNCVFKANPKKTSLTLVHSVDEIPVPGTSSILTDGTRFDVVSPRALIKVLGSQEDLYLEAFEGRVTHSTSRDLKVGDFFYAEKITEGGTYHCDK